MLFHLWLVAGLLLSLPGVLTAVTLYDDVSGPVVKLDEAGDKNSTLINATEAKPKPSETFAQLLDQALQKEFVDETKKSEGKKRSSYNATAKQDDPLAVVETVLRISSKTKAALENSLLNGTSNSTTTAVKKMQGESSGAAPLEEIDHTIDTIIDSKDNVFILSRPSDYVASLVIDPQLIQDLTLMLSSAGVFGVMFEIVKQPVINGFLVAGAVIGPGGLNLIKELVQVESLAQLGVQLLLFGLGMELSLSKLRAVWGGGALQIALSMLICGAAAVATSATMTQGVFVGALISMSSTSVVVKCLEVTKSMNSLYGQITIGTLILQDCFVGLMFALMPVFTPPRLPTLEEDQAEAKAVVILLVLKVFGKLLAALVTAAVLSKTLLPLLFQALFRTVSRELAQLGLVAFCLAVARATGEFGLSEELGAFLAGVMVSSAAMVTTNGLDDSLVHAARNSIDSIHNVLMALFIASIGLIMSPRFLMEHLAILTLGTILLLLSKALLVSTVVRFFGTPWHVALAVGVSMAHIGEFSFVLLSIAIQLKILPMQVYMLLLGITALSLLSTPGLIMLCNRLLRDHGKESRVPTVSSLKTGGLDRWDHASGNVTDLTEYLSKPSTLTGSKSAQPGGEKAPRTSVNGEANMAAWLDEVRINSSPRHATAVVSPYS
ncbi:MAG: hypothetical protein WDW38_000592 [Sanguina aurantia]